ncbi:VOC family protein [Hymenobacter radiodurans]|uniref:VOC family protein n=1 Tax=Hymenobacter radiodurans TaxID=2496028 RepID=UPI0010585EC8|nr:VOC family protein [Hymenobacter radiodurans]
MTSTLLAYSSLPIERIGHHPAQQLPTAISLGTVHLTVASLNRSLNFYQGVLGFHLLRHTPGAEGQSAMAELGVAGSSQVLVALHEQVGARPVPRRGRLGIYHFALLLPSRAELGRFLRYVRTQGVPIGSSDHIYSEATYLVDPDGFTVEVYRDRPRSEWLVSAEGEIQSALDPLDVAGVLQAAEDEPWQGLPKGTTMGHLHFYVGNLPEAAAFYHQALGLDIVTWSLSGALFLSTGGYHHQLALNEWAAGAPVATDEDARLLKWELWLPDDSSRKAAATRLQQAGYSLAPTPEGPVTTDPWGIRVLLRTEEPVRP